MGKIRGMNNLPANNCRNIVLIGMMGCGKTVVGQAISRKVSMPFIDTDTMIETRLKMTIPHIFEQYGESYFRMIESEAAKEAASQAGVVIATGGGMVMNPQNMAVLGATGFIIYLRCNHKQLYERTAGDKNRPLSDKLEELLKLREPLYKSYSNFTIDSATTSINRLAEMIWDEYCGNKRA